MESLPVQERHLCFVCSQWFAPGVTQLCPSCHWLRCPRCGGCACGLGEEGRRVLKAFALTYCQGCVYGQFPKQRPRPIYITRDEVESWVRRAMPDLWHRYEIGELDFPTLLGEIDKRMGRPVVIIPGSSDPMLKLLLRRG